VAAQQAAEDLKQWDKANDDVKAGAVGVLLSDGKGGIKQDLTGPRAGGKGAAIGAILGLIAAVPTGGLSLLSGILGGGVGGGIIGSFFHKHLGMSEQERDGLAKEIAGGCAAVGVLAEADEAGAFTAFYFQAESPGPDKESNWLPTGTEAWFAILRLYMPRPEIVNATWECPALKRAD
jgi:hypothetical protein